MPQQPAYRHPATGGLAQRLDRRSVVGEQFVGVAAPAHELDRVPSHRIRPARWPGLEVHLPVHPGMDDVALGPRPKPWRGSRARRRRGTSPRAIPPAAAPAPAPLVPAGAAPPRWGGDQRRAQPAVRAIRHVDLRAVHVEHLPSRDQGNPVPVAKRGIDEHLGVVPPVVTDEHPSQLACAPRGARSRSACASCCHRP